MTTTFLPAQMLEVELSRPIPAVSAYNPRTERSYRRALMLVRLYGRPLGLVELSLADDGLSADAHAAQIWAALSEPINAELARRGAAALTALPPDGLAAVVAPAPEAGAAALPFASVIIATRDRPHLLRPCLDALLAQDIPSYELIVVDNAPQTDATARLIHEAYGRDPRVRYLREDRPGLSWARNCGLREARGTIIAYTDDDVKVDRGWLRALVRPFTLDDEVACVTGLTLPLELETQAQGWFEQAGGFSRGFTYTVFDAQGAQTASRATNLTYPYTGLPGTGNNMAFTAAFLRAIGGFDPALGAGTPTCGGEDLSAFFQVIKRRKRLVYEPAALNYHLHRRDYEGLHRQIYGYGIGFSAFITRMILADPRLLLELAWKVPIGLFSLFHPASLKNRQKRSDYPAELTRLERKGMLAGPRAYLRSRRAAQRIAERFGSNARSAGSERASVAETGVALK